MDFDRELKKCDELMERLCNAEEEIKRCDELMERIWSAEESIKRLKEEVKNVRGTLTLEKRLIDRSIKEQAEGTPTVKILREMYEEEKDLRRKTALSQAIGAINYQTEHRTLF